MKILKTNWVNILIVFVGVYLYAIFAVHRYHSSFNLFQAFISAGISVCLYGILFWLLFIILLIILDLLLIVKSQKNLRSKLLFEWILISLPFIYWAIKYKEWIFLVGVLIFLITQFLREKLILQSTPN
ncbi:hypothetical protein [Compostibacter hankyongensis]|uniref:Uncharacterized protein n=1 Tax=Compostibacter hankyongensis TaxID=1007089 RepID=A0ABP8G333_9BACT